MDILALFSQLREIQPRTRIALATGIAGLTLFVLGLIWSFAGFSQGSQAQNVEFIPHESVAGASSSAQLLAVDVAGAVMNPGVYQLAVGARIQDALVSAGGLSENADRTYVSKSLNLAAKVSDGGKIYIPAIGEAVAGSTANSLRTTAGAVDSSLNAVSGLVNLNSASSAELDKLPGIGAVTSQKIIDNRPYSSIDELKSKKVVSSKVYEQIKDKVSTY